MRMRLLHIMVLAAMLCGAFASCSDDEADVIPRSKLAWIYAEMLMTDQWITSTPGVRMIADTSLVYEPILEKYGFDSGDYRKSVEYYMNDPERFARILRTTGEILDKRIKKLEELERIQALRDKLPKIEADFHPDEFFPYLFEEPYVHYYDSIAFVPDSSLWIYRIISIERADTIYDQLRMIILDSLVAGDTLELKDSLVLKDSLMLADSVVMIEDKVLNDSVLWDMKKTAEDPVVRGRERSSFQGIIMDNAEQKD